MHSMHLLPSVAIQPNVEFKTRPKQLLGSLPLVIVLPGISWPQIWPRMEAESDEAETFFLGKGNNYWNLIQ
jgi:hypothetical protein